MEEDSSLVDRRSLRRQEVNETGVSTWTSKLLPALPIVLSCGLFAANIGTTVFVALPELLFAGLYSEVALQLASLALGGVVGASVSAADLGIWSKVDRLPQWFRWSLVTGTFGFFCAAPFAATGAIALAVIRNELHPYMWTGVLAQQWIEGAGVVQLILGLILQTSAMASFGVDLSVSVSVGFLLLVKVAIEHDTHRHVYLRLSFKEGQDQGFADDSDNSRVDSVALITGPLETLVNFHALPMFLFRVMEVTASLGSIALFHAGTQNYVTILGIDVGGLLLLVVQFAAHAAIFHFSSDWMTSCLTRSFSACVFIPKPTLDAEVPSLAHYAVMAAAQVSVIAVDVAVGLKSQLPQTVGQSIRVAVVMMWPLLLVLRLGLAKRGVVPASAVELAAKVKNGAVELHPLRADHAQLSQLTDFCEVFCQNFFGQSFSCIAGSAKLDLTDSKLDVEAVCAAMVLAEPLLKHASHFELNLDGCKVKDADLVELMHRLPAAMESFEVNLGGTLVGDVGLVRLAQVLPEHMTSLEVGFNSTRVTDKGISVLAQHLPPNLVKLEVILYNTDVGDKGMSALAAGLPRTLTSFRAGLYKTKVGDPGVIAMASNMPKTLQVFRMELAGTLVGNAGANALIDNLPENVVKFEANVSGTKVSGELVKQLKEASSFPAYRGRQKVAFDEEIGETQQYCCLPVPFFGA